jgi:hypothetical protein
VDCPRFLLQSNDAIWKKTKGIHHDALDTMHRVAFKNWSDKMSLSSLKDFSCRLHGLGPPGRPFYVILICYSNICIKRATLLSNLTLSVHFDNCCTQHIYVSMKAVGTHII